MNQEPSRPKSATLLVGHSGRLMFGTKNMTLIFLAQIALFAMAMLHDEFAQYLVEVRQIAATNVGAVEVVFGIILFVLWLLLTVAFAHTLNTSPAAD